jgi:hypothetical protein
MPAHDGDQTLERAVGHAKVLSEIGIREITEAAEEYRGNVAGRVCVLFITKRRAQRE